jgi:hypothetical protein
MPLLILNGAMRKMSRNIMGVFVVMRRFALLFIVGSCILIFGCGKSPLTWSAESKSPDGKMIATAKTFDESGPGTDFIQTTVFLNRTTNKNAPTMILQAIS